jgi:hypothetical protein
VMRGVQQSHLDQRLAKSDMKDEELRTRQEGHTK